MNEQDQRKVVEGLTLFIEDSLSVLGGRRLEGDEECKSIYGGVTRELRDIQEVLRVVKKISYFPEKDYRRLDEMYGETCRKIHGD